MNIFIKSEQVTLDLKDFSTPIYSILILQMYSNNLKQITLKLYTSFNSLRKVATLLNINYSTISKWSFQNTLKLNGRNIKKFNLSTKLISKY